MKCLIHGLIENPWHQTMPWPTFCLYAAGKVQLLLFWLYADQIPPGIRRLLRCMDGRVAGQNPLITVHIRRICPLDIISTPPPHWKWSMGNASHWKSRILSRDDGAGFDGKYFSKRSRCLFLLILLQSSRKLAVINPAKGDAAWSTVVQH